MIDESDGYKAWLAGLKAGDEILKHSPDSGDIKKAVIEKVARGYIYIGSVRFSVKTGNEQKEGGRFTKKLNQLQPLSRTDLIAAHNARVLHAKMVVSIEKTDWRRLTTDQLARVAAIIGEVQS